MIEKIKTIVGETKHQITKCYVALLNKVQNTAFQAASKTGYCHICGSYPHRPTPTKAMCSRCGIFK